ncbi:radical SAM protein [Candidatus Formimonas warabiya]|uniref:Radical SAM core domain-containing protein n=1 Tax=Formimonas warabiya TaxID=1761012 RepID=A0A3G1KTK1_FORW1|nr:radical SAM protein [Candidatus Formimonas warabiya]ATW25833.1 hypothetical protein DCMF_14620 [Candidatus Formimonas warabiya]
MEITRERIFSLLQTPFEELLAQAWAIRRQHHFSSISFAAPSAKHYEIDGYQNSPHAFAAISLTGSSCALGCEHCKGKLLESMAAVKNSRDLMERGERLRAAGCAGILLSGGADAQGEVPLLGWEEGIAGLKKTGLKIIVHTGLVSPETARMLHRCQVDQVLVDVIGDGKTIRDVYHLDRNPDDYGESLRLLHAMGLYAVPHLVAGLHYGEIRGEYEALYQIAQINPPILVIVVFNPLPGTPMAQVKGPLPEEVAQVIALARILNPQSKVMLGCARPAGKKKKEIEHLALRAGVNGMAYPTEETVKLAGALGLEASFSPLCCSLL